MSKESNPYLLGGGISSFAAAAFMIRDGGFPSGNIFILEAKSLLGGSLDGAGNPVDGYSMRGGRMLTTDNYKCTWDLYKSILSLRLPGKTVFDETMEFNKQHKTNSMARLVDSRRGPNLASASLIQRHNLRSRLLPPRCHHLNFISELKQIARLISSLLQSL